MAQLKEFKLCRFYAFVQLSFLGSFNQSPTIFGELFHALNASIGAVPQLGLLSASCHRTLFLASSP